MPVISSQKFLQKGVSNMSDFKTDLKNELDRLVVSEELKTKTFAKCNQVKRTKLSSNVKRIIALSSAAAIIGLSVFAYSNNWFFKENLSKNKAVKDSVANAEQNYIDEGMREPATDDTAVPDILAVVQSEDSKLWISYAPHFSDNKTGVALSCRYSDAQEVNFVIKSSTGSLEQITYTQEKNLVDYGDTKPATEPQTGKAQPEYKAPDYQGSVSAGVNPDTTVSYQSPDYVDPVAPSLPPVSGYNLPSSAPTSSGYEGDGQTTPGYDGGNDSTAVSPTQYVIQLNNKTGLKLSPYNIAWIPDSQAHKDVELTVTALDKNGNTLTELSFVLKFNGKTYELK